jgi:hypothetical protein
MFRFFILSVSISLALAVGPAASGETQTEDDKLVSGMSIIGNDEAPKSLAIVPWKGSELGQALNAIRALVVGRQPVDKEVFMRELDYYQIRVGSRDSRGLARK